MSDIDRLLAAARHAQAKAYAPYSKYHVGAALLCPSGAVYAGCNVENAAFPQGACAEAAAIAAMILAGEQTISAVLTVCPGDLLGTCCGGCRQRIREFAALDTPIYAANENGIQRSFTLEELLPFSFGPDHLPGR